MNRLFKVLCCVLLPLSVAAAVFFGIAYFRLSARLSEPQPVSEPQKPTPSRIFHKKPAAAPVKTEDAGRLMEDFYAQLADRNVTYQITDDSLRAELQARQQEESFKAQFVPDGMPVGADNFLSQGFGEKHQALDFAAPDSAMVYAAAAGVVRFVCYDEYLGNVLAVDHLNGWVSLYAHLATTFREQGQYVEKGEGIALVGNTGRSTAPHLHFEIWHDGKRLDPATVLHLETVELPIPE